MSGRTSHRAVRAVVGAVLALSALLFPSAVASLSLHAPRGPVEHAVAARPLPTTATQPAAPVARSIPAHRLIGFAAAVHATGFPSPLLAAVVTALGLLLAAGTPGRSRLSADQRRPRGPPALRPASLA